MYVHHSVRIEHHYRFTHQFSCVWYNHVLFKLDNDVGILIPSIACTSHAHTHHDRAVHIYMCTHAHTPSLFQVKRSFYSGSSERARLHRWPSGWQTWLAIFKRTQSAYKPIDLLDLLYLAQKFASALNLRPSSRSSLTASLSS